METALGMLGELGDMEKWAWPVILAFFFPPGSPPAQTQASPLFWAES